MVPAVASRGSGTLPSHGTHFGDLVSKIWQHDQLAERLGPLRHNPIPANSLRLRLSCAQHVTNFPTWSPRFVAYAGSIFSSSGHFLVFMASHALRHPNY